MKKKVLSVLLALCLLVGCLPMAASAASVTERENNNTTGAAQSITIGNTISGNIAPTGDIDYYRFNIASAGRVTLNITSHMQYYTLHIYDTSGAELWYTDHNEYNATVGFRQDVYTVDLLAGTYFLKVTGFEYSTYFGSTGSYTIQTSFVSANSNETEPNNSVDQAKRNNSVSIGSTIKGQIAENDRYDFHKFVLSRAGRITFDITSYMQYYCLIVYDATGTELWYTDHNEYNSTVGFRQDVYSLDLLAGTYYLKVTGYEYAEYYASTGNYSIKTSFASANATESEPNNSASQAETISLGETIKGQIAINDRYDFFKFTLSSSVKLNIHMISYMQYYTLHIYNTAGKELWYRDRNEYNETAGFREDTHTVDLSSGIYYLKVTGYKYNDYYASTGNYTLTVGGNGASTDVPDPGKVAVTGVSLSETSLELLEGETASLTATVKPANASNKAVTWSSSDTSVATVTSGGTVKGVSKGTATVTARTSDGGYTARCSVTVTEAEEDTPIGTGAFSDVAGGAWYSPAIQEAVEAGIISGYSDGSFRPKNNITRRDFAILIAKVMGADLSSSVSSPFWDVSESDYGKKAIAFCKNQGLISGYKDGSFQPKKNITRQEAAVIMAKALHLSGSSGTSFRDDGKIAGWAVTAVSACSGAGIFSGDTKGNFNPAKNITRAETAAIMVKALKW